MGRAERAKGVRGELEVLEHFRRDDAFPFAERAAFGTNQLSGDLVGIPGLVVAVKRAEVLRLPLWIREADGLVDGRGDAPVVCYRTSARGPVPSWRADLPLETFVQIYRHASEAWRSPR